MALTDTAIRNGKPGEKASKLADAVGLYVLLNPNGSKWWRLDYRFGGKRKTLSMGVYPATGLKDAISVPFNHLRRRLCTYMAIATTADFNNSNALPRLHGARTTAQLMFQASPLCIAPSSLLEFSRKPGFGYVPESALSLKG